MEVKHVSFAVIKETIKNATTTRIRREANFTARTAIEKKIFKKRRTNQNKDDVEGGVDVPDTEGHCDGIQMLNGR
jgi:hypothetical protein